MNAEDRVDGPTADGRWLVVRGRRWRRQDPEIPEAEAARLRRHLGRARNAVKQARNAAGRDREPAEDDPALAAPRRRVGVAKQGLGERGTPWWEQEPAERRARWEAALAELAELDPEGARAPESPGRS